MLLGLIVIAMVLETLSIGMIIPALVLMTQGDLATKYPMLLPWLNVLGNPDHERLVVIGMLLMVAMYTTKALFLAFLTWKQMQFVYGVQAELSYRLFISYLRQPYTFHLQYNSAQLIRNVLIETNLFTHTVLITGVTFVAELLVLFGILALLLTVEPVGALLVIGILGFAGWGFNHYTRGHILRWGEARQYHEGQRIQRLQQGLGGAKDVKLLGRESDFLAKFRTHNSASAYSNQFQSTLQALPRLWLELLAIYGLAVLVFIMIGQGKPLGVLLPTLGLFAAAAFRLMPSANRLIGAIQSLRFSSPVIDTLHHELCLLDAPVAPQQGQFLPFQKKLALNNIGFTYPSTHSAALSEINLTIHKGDVIGFIGGSGAGKSTLVDIILGLLTPVSGTIKVDGIDIQKNLRGWQNQIGYVPQSIFLTDDTLRRNIAFGLPDEEIDETAVWHAIRAAQLEEYVNDLPQGLNTLVGERGVRLSGGQRQRIGIARALYHDPSVLVLDEATSSLDTDTERGIMDSVRALQGEKTFLIVAHRLSTVEHCDRIFRLEKGRIVEEGDAAVMLRKDINPKDS